MLHNMDLAHVKSTFPISLGARITGVDDCTYSSTGESFSAIGESRHVSRHLFATPSVAHVPWLTYRASTQCFPTPSPPTPRSSRRTMSRLVRHSFHTPCTVRAISFVHFLLAAYEFSKKVRSLRKRSYSFCFARYASTPPAFAHICAGSTSMSARLTCFHWAT